MRTPQEEELRRVRKKSFESAAWTLRLGAFVNGAFAGWSYSQQSGADEIHMHVSAVVPEFRRQGGYARLLNAVIERAQQEGYEILTSNHNPANAAVLIAKLKAGFVITGYSVMDIVGPQVNLSRYLQEGRERALRFRLGYSFADGGMVRSLLRPEDV